MGIAKNLINAAKGYFEEEEEKAYTLLSADDMKSTVPMFREGGSSSNSGIVPMWTSMDAWNSQINRALNGWNNSNINFASEVGDLRLSVLLMAAVRWAGVNLGAGKIQVVELDEDEKESNIQSHPLTLLFKKPNPDLTGKALWKQFAFSYVFSGEAYFLIARDNAGRVRELYFEPNSTIEPRWDVNKFPNDETANEFIRYFEIKRSGRWIPWRKKDVFRIYDTIDPVTRHGTNGVDALMRTIFTDQERETYTALLLRNFGVTPKAVAPKVSDTGIDVKKLASTLQRRFSGDERGKPTVFNEPMEVLDFGTDFSADAMEKIAHISESRVAAALGISVQSLKFMVSLQSSTYNNVREFRREDFEQWVMPVHEDFDEAAQNQILPQMDERENLLVRHDYSKVAIVQRDKMETAKETEILVKCQVIKQSEARERHSYEHEGPEYDKFLIIPARNEAVKDDTGEKEVPDDDLDESTKAAKVKDGELEEAADFWAKHDALDDVGKGLIDAKLYKPNGSLPS